LGIADRANDIQWLLITEAAMRINTDVTNRDIESAMHWLASLIGGPLDRRVAGFEKRERRNPMLAFHFRENFSLEATLVKTRRHSRKTGRFPVSPEYDLAYAFAVTAHRIYLALLGHTQRTFLSRMRDAVTNQHGARPLAFEIGMAVHFMRKGWDVDFVDYSGSARFDFLIRRQDVEIEVELKSASGDAGRKIHRKEMNRFADLIVPTTKRLADEQGCHLLRVSIPDRLPADEKQLLKIAALAAQAVESKSNLSGDCANIKYNAPNISDWPDPRDGEAAHEFFKKPFGINNGHIFFHGMEHSTIVAVLIESSAPDQVLKALADEAKHAADQCTGKRPAVIAIQLGDRIDRAELQILAKTRSALHAIASDIFENSKRLHVGSIAFTVPQVPGQQDGGVRLPSAPVVTLFNDNPLYRCPDASTLFRTSS
jgi:hypothetical protein